MIIQLIITLDYRIKVSKLLFDNCLGNLELKSNEPYHQMYHHDIKDDTLELSINNILKNENLINTFSESPVLKHHKLPVNHHEDHISRNNQDILDISH
jgi:hypothetical protein